MKVISAIASLCHHLPNNETVDEANRQLSEIEEIIKLRSGMLLNCSVIRNKSGKDKVEISACVQACDDIGNAKRSEWVRIIVKPCLINTISIRILGDLSKWDKETVDEIFYDALLSEDESPW